MPSVIFSVDAWVSPEDRRVGRRGGVSTLRLWIRDRKRDTEMEREKEARDPETARHRETDRVMYRKRHPRGTERNRRRETETLNNRDSKRERQRQ